jgi:uncharacterized protein YecE (DUF72 family)
VFYLGLSGYSYKEWQGEGLFYPPKLKQAAFLSHFAARYNALEAVGTWTRTPSEATVAKWIAETPAEFRICPKMHRQVTHFSRLKSDGDSTLAHFVGSLAPLVEAGKAGPVLVQLPPNLKRDDALLADFLSRIPPSPLRYAVEFRHPSWDANDVDQRLAERGAVRAIVEDDESGTRRTGDAAVCYVRLRKLRYTDDELASWAQEFLAQLQRGRDVYVFCRHADVEAPWLYADRIKEIVGA